MWYYTQNGERHGPLSQSGMKSLFEQRSITADTLVWQEGMTEWQPLNATRLASELQVPLPEGDAWEKCAFSGERCRRSEMVQIDGYWIGAEHKDAAVELLQQGGSLPVVELDSPFAGNVDLGHLMRSTWALLAPCLQLVIVLQLLVWIPGNLAINYMDTQVFTEDQTFKSFQFNGWVQALWGNLATGGILYVLSQQILGRPATFGSAVSAAFSNWGRLWVGSFLSGLMMIIGFILLIIPGFIAMVRTSFVNAGVVDGKLGGSDAVQESWNLTKGCGLQVFGYMFVVGIVCTLPAVIFGAVGTLVPVLEHWVVNAIVATIMELPLIYLLAFTLVFYRELKANTTRRKPY
jgi:hypothetical protein